MNPPIKLHPVFNLACFTVRDENPDLTAGPYTLNMPEVCLTQIQIKSEKQGTAGWVTLKEEEV